MDKPVSIFAAYRQICENANELLNAIIKLKPQSLKGTYMQSIAICTTMSPAVKVDIKTIGSAE